MSHEHVRIAIITAPRKTQYLGYTISQILKDPVVHRNHVKVFSDSTQRPDGIPEDIPCELSTQERIDEIQKETFYGTLNFIRAMEWVAHDQFAGVVFEDDVELAWDWLQRTILLGQAAERETEKWLLSLHHFYELGDFDGKRKTERGDEVMRWKEMDGFYGGQGLMFGPRVAKEFAAVLAERVRFPWPERGKWVMDMAVKNLCMSLGTQLWSCNPCMLQHVGDVSAVMGDRPPIRNRFFKG